MSIRKRIVTIDGPSGGGKSTASRALAAKLYFTYLDTGAMYRAVAYQCTNNGVAPEETEELNQLLASIRMELLPPQAGGDDVRVVVNGNEIGPELRTPEMGMLASKYSSLPAVRKTLTRLQQEIGKGGRIVAEGRDTGTVVFPEAAWKFFLDASPEERAQRRAAQLKSKGESVNEAELLAQIIQRDKDDRERSLAPLAAALDAITIDSTKLSAEEVVETMYQHVLQTSCCRDD
nr:(d)CMP kinase [uncultured Desulfobulbus sp.]